ncbi:hypothetical protein AWC00_27310 [Mycobacterium conspicuum]|nr:hypothetical protein AWC00_27310 [Mycobacterium conspicuum]
MTAGTAGGTAPAERRPTSAAGPARAEQARMPTGPASPAGGMGGGAGHSRPSIAAVTDQNPAVSTRLSRARRAVGTVTDQRTPQQRLGRRVDHAQKVADHRLQRRCVGALSAGIRARTRGQRLHELPVKRRCLGAQPRILLPIGPEQRCNRGRHLIVGRSHQLRNGPHRRPMRTANRRLDSGQPLRG